MDNMRNLLCLYSALLILCVSLSELVYFAAFKVNQNYIAALLCENRTAQEMHCNGKCYLIKQVKKNTPIHSHDATIPLINMDDYPISLVNWLTFDVQEYTISSDANFGKINMLSQVNLSVLLQPPTT